MSVKKTKHKEESASYYDKIYKSALRTGVYDVGRFEKIYEAVMYAVNPKSIILEVGCGTGELARRLVTLGHEYQGFDFSPEGLQHHSECTVCKTWCGNAYDSSNWTNVQYDTLIAVEVFEHLDDLRILKFVSPETQVVFSVPNFDSRSHLRTYPNMTSIYDYYDGVLCIQGHRRIETQEDKSIFVCDAVKI